MADSAWARALRRLDAVSGAHATSAVPLDQLVPGYRIALICIGIAFTLTGLYTGSELATSLGLDVGVRAVVLGSLVLTVMSVPAAIVGARTHLSTYMIVARVFGAQGSRVINLVLAIVLLGWYAVTAELFGRTCFLTAGLLLPGGPPQWVYTVGCSVLVVATTIFGFRAIDKLPLAAAPLLVALTAFVAWRSLGSVPWEQLRAVPANIAAAGAGAAVDLGTGISAVVGGLIVQVVLMPDMTRYSRSTLDCAVICIAGNGIGGGGALVLAMIPALAFHELDPMKYMALLGLTGLSFLVLVVSTWTINAVNLYSTGLVTATAVKGTSYGRIVIACGCAGTALSLIGVADRLIDFLVLLGVVVPPIAAVYLTDFFVLGRQDAGVITDDGATNINALLACFLGGLLGVLAFETNTSVTGVPSIESFVLSASLYAGAEWLRRRAGRDRLWRSALAAQ